MEKSSKRHGQNSDELLQGVPCGFSSRGRHVRLRKISGDVDSQSAPEARLAPMQRGNRENGVKFQVRREGYRQNFLCQILPCKL